MNGDRIEIPANRKENIKLIFFCIGFIGLTVFLILISEEQQMLPPPILKFISYLLLLFLVPSMSYVIYQLSDNSPRIIIDTAGLTDKTAATSPGFISWREIEGFRVKSIHSIPFLGIILKDPESFCRSTSPLTRVLNMLNNNLFSSSYLISVKTLDIEFDEFKELVLKFHQKYSGQAV